MKVYWLTLLMAFSCVVALGCGGGGSKNDSGSDGVAETQENEDDGSAIKRRKADSLPAIGAYLPPMDEGRIRIAPPAGWRPVARDSKYLARFVKGDASELPRIAVTATDSPSPEVTNVTEGNIEELVGPLTAKSKEGKRKPIEPVRPIILGPHVFARHVRIARMNNEPVAIVALQTVRDGRMYNVELYVEAGSDGSEYAKYLKQSQDAAYAVAANLKFGDDAEAGPDPMEAPSEEAKPADVGAESETPADES